MVDGGTYTQGLRKSESVKFNVATNVFNHQQSLSQSVSPLDSISVRCWFTFFFGHQVNQVEKVMFDVLMV